MKTYFKTPLAVYLILHRENEILLSLRQNTGYADGYYSLVAGHIEGEEPVTQAAIREAKEEANIILRPEDLRIGCVMHRKSIDAEYVDFFIVANHWQGEIINQEPHKCAELKFFPCSNFPENTLPYVQLGIHCAFNDIHFMEYGWTGKGQ